MEAHYQKILEDTQERVRRALQAQVLDPGRYGYGGFAEDSGIVQAKSSIYRVSPMTAVYCNGESVYYQKEGLLQRILLGLDYIRGVQHENGLFDYVTCNFQSAPDTAFCIKKLLPVYRYLTGKAGRSGLSPGEDQILGKLDPIVRDGARGLLEGGFHTPNHRWAIASVLMTCGKLFDDSGMTRAAYDYLKEGIDCNADGEYAEKSAGNYNRINNDAMIMLSQATGDPSYEQHAIRNLKMMLTYWEPDDSIFTANSTRFDKDLLIFPKDYYMEFLELGRRYEIPEFLQMCNTIFEIVDRHHITSPDFLIWFMLKPELRAVEAEGSFGGGDFRCYYRDSQIARGRQGSFTYTVMGGKSDFFYLHNGTMKLMMKVAGSFCEHRAFRSLRMERVSPQEYHLSQTMEGWYYLPFREKPDTSDWWKMDNASREKKLGPDLQIDVWVKEVPAGADIRVKTAGVAGAPWRIELAFTGVSFLTNEYLDMPLSGGETLVIKQGDTEVTNGKDALTIGPCFGEHHFTEGKEDSEARIPGAATLYLTAYTPFDHTIQIRNRRDQQLLQEGTAAFAGEDSGFCRRDQPQLYGCSLEKNVPK